MTTNEVEEDKVVNILSLPYWFLFLSLIPIWLSAGAIFAASIAFSILAWPYVIENIKGGPLDFWLNLWTVAWNHGEIGIPATLSTLFFIWRQWNKVKLIAIYGGGAVFVLLIVNVSQALLGLVNYAK